MEFLRTEVKRGASRDRWMYAVYNTFKADLTEVKLCNEAEYLVRVIHLSYGAFCQGKRRLSLLVPHAPHYLPDMSNATKEAYYPLCRGTE